ncbi:MAG: enoyl-CoA hydratase/isomerase family protein [Acidimicrobiales bacterium]
MTESSTEPASQSSGSNGQSAGGDTGPEVLMEVNDHVAVLTLNRPHRRNAISMPMLDLLGEYLDAADNDPDVRCIVLTGAGKGFCSGLDLVDATEGSGIGSEAAQRAGVRHITTRTLPTTILFQLDTPIIAALNGGTAGYGLDLALGCDIRIADRSARIVPGFAKRGVVPESGGTWYLPRLLGVAKASEIGFLGRDLTGEEAAEIGLVNRSVDDGQALAAAVEWATEIAGNAPLAVQAMKRLYRSSWTQDFESHSHHVLLQVMQLFNSNDFREGIASFMEKRPPKFEGR